MPANDIIRSDGQQVITNVLENQAQLMSLDRPVLGETVAMIQSFSGLRAAYLISSRDENGDIFDISGQGRVMTNNGGVTFGVNGQQPYAIFDGATQWFERPDEAGLDITGALTIGAWIYNNDPLSGTGSRIIRKGPNAVADPNPNLSYSLNFQQFVVNDGAARTIITSPNVVYNKWCFQAGVYYPGTKIQFWRNNEIVESASAPAALCNSPTPVTIGASSTPGEFFPGYITLAFICADSLSEDVLRAFYGVSRNLFGV